MFCMNCGKPTEGDKRLCPACEAAKAAQQPVYQQPVYRQPTAPQQPAAQNVYQPAPQQPAMNLNLSGQAPEPKKPAEPKKKKKTVLAVIASVLAVAVLFTTLGFACWDWGGSLSYSLVKLTKDEKGAALYVEEKALEKEGIPLLSEGYSDLVTSSGAGGMEAALSLQVGDSVVDMIVDNADMENPEQVRQLLAVLQNIRISMAATSADGATQADIMLGLNDVDVLALRMITDYMTGEGFLGLPELSDTYLALDLEDSGLNADQMLALMEASQELTRNLPDEDSFNQLISRYVLVALSSLDDVDESVETEEIDGVKQKFTVYTYRIDEAAARDMLIAVLEEAQYDNDLQDLVEAFCQYYNACAEIAGYYYEQVDANELFASLPYLIEELEAMDTDPGNGSIRINTYVDSTGKICGRSMSFPDDVTVSYLSTSKGNKRGFALSFDSYGDTIEVKGSGVEHGDKLSGSYSIFVTGFNVAKIELEDFNTENCTGIIRAKPSSSVQGVLSDTAAEMGGPWVDLLQDGNLELEIVLTETSADATLLANGQMLLQVGLSAQETDGTDIYAPEEYTYCYSEDDLMEWLAEVDLAALLDKLEQAGVPKDLLNLLNSSY